jgi:acyl-CoA thioester hydrolase
MFPMQTKSRRIDRMIATTMPATPLVTALRVRFAECDMQGHVFSGHYLMYFDLAHTEALRSATGMTYPELVQAHGTDLVVAESGVRYLAPAYYDDLLEIAVTFAPATRSSLTSRFAVTRTGATIATGFLRHVCVDSKDYKKAPWPDALRAALAPYMDDVSAESNDATTPSRPT